MPTCNVKVTINVKGKIDAVIGKIKSAAAAKHLKFQGDATKGTLVGKGEKASYTVKGQVITVSVSSKQWLVKDAHVKQAITKLFQG